MNSNEISNGFMKDVRIIDLADERAGFCTKLLADLGACVIKVEKPGGHASRSIGPFYKTSDSSAQSTSFFYNNTNKYGITLNLDHHEGRSIFVDLIKKSDVLVETFPPGYLRRKGLHYEKLSQVNSRLISVSVTGFGKSGPHRNFKSCDLVAAASGGQMYANGSPTKAPLKSYGDQSYYPTSLFAVYGILLALRKRRQTGKGEHVDISMQASVAATLEHVLSRYFTDKTVFKRQGSQHWNDEFVILPCRDGFINITVFQHWDTLIEWLDAEGMAADLKNDVWRDERYRRNHGEHIVGILKKWVANHSVDELYATAQLMRFPWAPVRTPQEVLECPQHKARGFFIKKEPAELGVELNYPGMPFKTSDTYDPPNRPAPLPGEHNHDIYSRVLGMAEETIKRLYRRNVI